MAVGYHCPEDIRGSTEARNRSAGVTGGWYPPAEGCMLQFGPAFRAATPTPVTDHFLGNSVGAIGWLGATSGGLGPGRPRAGRSVSTGAPTDQRFWLPLGAFRRWLPPRGARRSGQDSYLVDSASSHMLVSKIKPCMSKYKQSIR